MENDGQPVSPGLQMVAPRRWPDPPAGETDTESMLRSTRLRERELFLPGVLPSVDREVAQFVATFVGPAARIRSSDRPLSPPQCGR
jgi:hypothetical protein